LPVIGPAPPPVNFMSAAASCAARAGSRAARLSASFGSLARS
jgi:hypothetical protein